MQFQEFFLKNIRMEKDIEKILEKQERPIRRQHIRAAPNAHVSRNHTGKTIRARPYGFLPCFACQGRSLRCVRCVRAAAPFLYALCSLRSPPLLTPIPVLQRRSPAGRAATGSASLQPRRQQAGCESKPSASLAQNTHPQKPENRHAAAYRPQPRHKTALGSRAQTPTQKAALRRS